MSSTDNNNNNGICIANECANCGEGEEESSSLKRCGACLMVKYCSTDCQQAHRPQHKKECKRRVAELHNEKLFKQPPPLEDCPICFLRLPSLHTGSKYHTCCGKVICSGCAFAPVYDNQGNEIAEIKCQFCRTPEPTSDEDLSNRVKKRIEEGDAIAIYNLGVHYADGIRGKPQDHTKALELWHQMILALELWHQAGKSGYALAYANIGYAYSMVEVYKLIRGS